MLALLLTLALAAPTVELVDAGTGRRSPLVVTAPVGQAETGRLRLTLTTRTKADGQLVPTEELPPVTLGLASEVVEAGPPLVHRLRVTEVGVEGEASPLGDAIREALAPLVGLEGTIRLAPHGTVLEQQWSQVDGVDPSLVDELRRALDAIHPPRPSEPLGVGAVWTAREVQDDGFPVTHTATWTLAERTDARTVLTAQLAQEAEPGHPLSLEGLPPGAQGHLAHHLAVGEARVVLRTGRVLPEELLEGMTTKSTLEVVDGDTTSQMSIIAGHQLTVTASGPASE